MSNEKLRKESPSYWIEVAKEAYIDGVEDALRILPLLVEAEHAKKFRIPSCEFSRDKPHDIQDYSKDTYDWWRMNHWNFDKAKRVE